MRSNGEIKWCGAFIFVSEVLPGETVALSQTASGDWLVRFADVELGLIDGRNKRFRRFTAPRPGRREAQEQTGEPVTHVPGPNCHL